MAEWLSRQPRKLFPSGAQVRILLWSIECTECANNLLMILCGGRRVTGAGAVVRFGLVCRGCGGAASLACWDFLEFLRRRGSVVPC
jgi:hypothetical protein